MKLEEMVDLNISGTIFNNKSRVHGRNIAMVYGSFRKITYSEF